MMKAPGAVTSQPSEDMLPMLAITVGIMKIPAPIMFPATSIVAGKRPICLVSDVIAPSRLSGLFDRRLRDDLLLELAGLRPEILPQESAEVRRPVKRRERPI